MRKLSKIAGVTLIEMLIGVAVSSIMIAAMYSSYTVINNSYSKVTDVASISRSGRDIVAMLMRDIRMAGFKYFLGINEKDHPTRSPLEFNTGKKYNEESEEYENILLEDSHDPLIIIKDELGYTASDPGTDDTDTDAKTKWNTEKDLCCDKIHIVYDDFNQNDEIQPYKRYKITYYAKKENEGEEDERYQVWKSVESWVQVLHSDGIPDETGEWKNDCLECYNEKIRDHVVDMEFIAFNHEGRIINPNDARPDNTDADKRGKIYDTRAVDVRLTFRSKREFFRFAPSAGKPRLVKGLSDRTIAFLDKYLRDSVVVTIHTRNIGEGI